MTKSLFVLAGVASVVHAQSSIINALVTNCLLQAAGSLGCQGITVFAVLPCICTSSFYRSTPAAPLALIEENCPASIVQDALNRLVPGCNARSFSPPLSLPCTSLTTPLFSFTK
ncbi:hypothetical protein BD410DRAFT_843831 [Rickenella mellea]|uniref:Bifunctional inhibitor/plant lipid transfer protein/seed storage helical domain-containing protein n=1 Tax=Rickenella mellea TaxID=50990 RepID=A0A4Y7PRH2_9AGAM|nr:hypothetical protein BD410DRAFT_843831 [Rickenella mellea]